VEKRVKLNDYLAVARVPHISTLEGYDALPQNQRPILRTTFPRTQIAEVNGNLHKY
jgi:hypothetical protein